MQLIHDSELFFSFLFLKYWKYKKKKRKLQRIAAFGRVKFFTNIQLISLLLIGLIYNNSCHKALYTVKTLQ